MIDEAEARRLARRVAAGERRALARAITLVESTNAAHRPAKQALLDAVVDDASPAATVRLGISGTPGVGKSTLIEALGVELLDRGHRLAVLAVDPSSERSGGSILGDKTRMPRLAVHEDAYVRPSASAGGLGGITASTAAVITLCEAAGFDTIIVETVGVGQSETAVSGVTDLFVLLHSPAGGDELQGIKRGVMELADRIVVTKADGDLTTAARIAKADLEAAVGLLRPKQGRSRTEVSLISAATGHGVDDLIDSLAAQHSELRSSGHLDELRRHQRLRQFERTVEEGVRPVADRWGSTADRTELERAVADARRTPLSAALSWLGGIGDEGAQFEINAITLAVADMARSIAFYRALGLVEQWRAADLGFVTFAHGANFVNLELDPSFARDGAGWGRVILFCDPDEVYARAQSAGLRAEFAPRDAPWGERYFHIRDPDGHELSFARRL